SSTFPVAPHRTVPWRGKTAPPDRVSSESALAGYPAFCLRLLAYRNHYLQSPANFRPRQWEFRLRLPTWSDRLPVLMFGQFYSLDALGTVLSPRCPSAANCPFTPSSPAATIDHQTAPHAAPRFL